jgi:hypothetical protein
MIKFTRIYVMSESFTSMRTVAEIEPRKIFNSVTTSKQLYVAGMVCPWTQLVPWCLMLWLGAGKGVGNGKREGAGQGQGVGQGAGQGARREAGRLCYSCNVKDPAVRCPLNATIVSVR